MLWHYVEEEAPVGPVSDAEIRERIAVGRIQGDTLLWREGLADWTPMADVPAFAQAAAAEPEPPASGISLRTQQRSFRRIEDQAEAPLSVMDLRADALAPAPTADEEDSSGFLDWLFYISPWEFRFFSFTFALAAVATGIAALLPDAGWLYMPFLLHAIAVNIVGGVLFRIRSFQVGILWGLGGIFLPLVDLVFLVVHWSVAKRPFLLCLAGFGVLIFTLGWMMTENPAFEPIVFP